MLPTPCRKFRENDFRPVLLPPAGRSGDNFRPAAASLPRTPGKTTSPVLPLPDERSGENRFPPPLFRRPLPGTPKKKIPLPCRPMQSEGRDVSSCRGAFAALPYCARGCRDETFPERRASKHGQSSQGQALGKAAEDAFCKTKRHARASLRKGRSREWRHLKKHARVTSRQCFRSLLPGFSSTPTNGVRKKRRLRENALPLRAAQSPKRPPCPGAKHGNKPAALAPQRHFRRRRQKNVRLDGAGKPRL